MVSFMKGSWRGVEAGFKYLIMSSMAGAVILLCMSMIYGMVGSLNMATIASTFRTVQVNPWLIAVFATILLGFGVKSAVVPLHNWLPDAYAEAPDPISALLAGIATETALYALTRILYIAFEPSVFIMPIAVLAAITMTAGNILALRQDDLKRLLYSSVSQMGYVIGGLGLRTYLGCYGGLVGGISLRLSQCQTGDRRERLFHCSAGSY